MLSCIYKNQILLVLNLCNSLIVIILCHWLDLHFFKWMINYVRPKPAKQRSVLAYLHKVFGFTVHTHRHLFLPSVTSFVWNTIKCHFFVMPCKDSTNFSPALRRVQDFYIYLSANANAATWKSFNACFLEIALLIRLPGFLKHGLLSV